MKHQGGSEFPAKARGYLRSKAVRGNAIVYRVLEEAGKTPVSAGGDGGQSGSSKEAKPSPSGRSVAEHSEQRVVLPEGVRYSTSGAVQSGLFGGEEEVAGNHLDQMDLNQLAAEVEGCRACDLHRGRTNAVFGVGKPTSRIVFIGEAPGREEDLQGIPFVGRAGKLLDKILAAIEFSRDDVYITNILKCRPPGNRDPVEEEVKACEGYLKRQLELIDPVIICALGRVAAQNLLKTKLALGKLRGKVHYYNDIKTLVTYHPAALLRNPHFKRPAWEDIKKLKEIFDDAS